MKKVCIILCTAFFSMGIQAQPEGLFDHLSIGAGFGIINGGVVEIALPITHYAAIRGGYNFFPIVKGTEEFDVVSDTERSISGPMPALPGKVKLQAEPFLSTGHLLLDIYPFRGSSFHLTGGAYLGKEQVITAKNSDGDSQAELADIYQYNNRLGAYSSVPESAGKFGLECGDFLLEPDARGNIDAFIKVKRIRPYAGLGFGRAVPMKHRFAFGFDMGLQFWGTPEIFVDNKKIEKGNLAGKGESLFEAIGKVSAAPIISCKLVGRIF